jgi:quercetin dioxygenase-like cupin family protein
MHPTIRISRRLTTLALGAWLAACVSSATASPEPEPPLTRTVDSNLQWGPCPAIFPAGCQIAVLHGDPGKPNADVFLRVPGGYDIPSHSHTSAERMVLVQGELRVHYDGAAAETLTVGEYAYGPAKRAHKATCKAGGPCTLFIAFEGPVDGELAPDPKG